MLRSLIKRFRSRSRIRPTAERDLLRSDVLSLFVAHSPAAIAMLDRNMRYIMVTNRWLKSYGLVGQDLIGKSHYEVFPEIPARWRELHRQGLQGASAASGEDLFIRSDGRRIWERWRIEPWHTANADVGGILLFTEDITELKEARELISKGAAQRRRIIDTTHEGVWLVGADAITTFANRRMTEMLGYEEGEMQGRPIWDFVDEEMRPLAAENWRRRQKGISENHEFRLRRKDGSELWTLMATNPIYDENGRFEGALAMVADLTARKHAEQAILQAKALAEEADRTKDRFLLIVSHELRTPLSVILGWAKELKSKDLSSEVARRAFAAIERNADIQLRLVEDLLDTAQILTGKLRVELQPLSLTPIVNDVVTAWQVIAAEKRVGLRVDAGQDLFQIAGDPVRLKQILNNLLSNALKFTPAGGHVDVILNAVGTYVELVVADDGEGIAAEFLPQLFSHFVREDDSVTRRYGGLGLGLSLVRHLVSMHGGQVQAESPGRSRGATFRVRLPLLEPLAVRRDRPTPWALDSEAR